MSRRSAVVLLSCCRTQDWYLLLFVSVVVQLAVSASSVLTFCSIPYVLFVVLVKVWADPFEVSHVRREDMVAAGPKAAGTC